MEQTDTQGQQNTDHLMESLQELHTGYKETKELLDEQMQAVIYNDVVQLNLLTDRQMEKYEKLKEMEEAFKEHLVVLFQSYYPDASHPSLTRLIETIEGPTREIDRLRVDLYDQIHQTEQLRLQLMNLLQFASDYNSGSIEELSRAARQSYKNYKGNGRMEEGRSGSLGLNKTV